MAKKKPVKNPKVARTRGAGTLTEAQYWAKVRNALRQTFSRWKPAYAALKQAECGTRINPKTGKDRKVYRCAMCGGADYPELMQIDHIEPCGSLRSAEDMVQFLERLTCEDTSKFQVLHKTCHQAKTNESRRPKG